MYGERGWKGDLKWEMAWTYPTMVKDVVVPTVNGRRDGGRSDTGRRCLTCGANLARCCGTKSCVRCVT